MWRTLTDLDTPLVHICDPPKFEFDVLLRHHFYGHDTHLMHIARVLWGVVGCVMQLMGGLLLQMLLIEQKWLRSAICKYVCNLVFYRLSSVICRLCSVACISIKCAQHLPMRNSKFPVVEGGQRSNYISFCVKHW